MSFIDKLNEIEIAKNNIKASLESKGKQPGNDIREYSAIINSLNGDIPSSTKVKVIIQELEPEDTAYQGFWIKSNDYTYNEIHMISKRDEKQPNSINIIKNTKRNKYKTILVESDVSGGLYWDFNEVLITDENNNVLWNIPIYYGNDLNWVDITPSDIHWAGVTVDFMNNSITEIEGSYNVDELLCYSNRIRCNMTDNGTVTARYGESEYDNNGNENLQVMVEQPIVYVKVDNVTLQSDGKSIAKADYCVADGPMEGYSVHWAFNVDGNIYQNIYLNAYEGSVTNSKLCSYNTKAVPAYGGSKPTYRTYAQNRGEIWRIWTMLAQHLEILLILIEYKTFRPSEVLAKGVYSGTQVIGQVTNLDENGTGFQNGDSTANLSFAYRYRENPYGNQELFLEGYSTDSSSNQYISNSHFADSITETTYNKKVLGYKAGDGYTKSFYYIADYPYLFLHSGVGSNDDFIHAYNYRYGNEKTISTYPHSNTSSSLRSMLHTWTTSNSAGATFSNTGACLMCYPPDQIIEN